jgi:ribonucleoside-diphosphate reductase beta chain
MIQEAVDIELEYGKYLIDNYSIMGLREDLIVNTVHNYANERLKRIGLEPIFKESEKTYLQKLVDKNLSMNDVKQNFFETNVTNYAKNSIDFDDF